MRIPLLALTGLVAAVAPATAQGYRARVDIRAQGASFRGVQLDSILASQAVTQADGSLLTADGIAVRCPGTDPWCRFFRPGIPRRGGPLTAAVDVTAWGLGLAGLSVRANARLGTDLGSTDVWPGTSPQGELLEGYAEYASSLVTARAGRVQSFNRLGAIGYDGATVTGRLARLNLEATAFGGLGLAHASALPINNPALDPLDQYQPSRRQIVAGGALGWSSLRGAARIMYQREVDRRSRYFISERIGFDATLLPPVRGLSLSGGGDFDLALDDIGSAEGTLSYWRGPVSVSVGGRRYRPHFDLWTIWGAFSPVPYRAGNAALSVRPVRQVTLSARGETYDYEPTGAETALATYVESGWRWSVEALVQPVPALDASAGYRRELGPGAASSGLDFSATYRQDDRLTLAGFVATLDRPLEFRFDAARVWSLGLRVDARPVPWIQVGLGASRFNETRDRPDAAAFDWDQSRLDLRVTLFFDSGPDLTRLPPATPGTR